VLSWVLTAPVFTILVADTDAAEDVPFSGAEDAKAGNISGEKDTQSYALFLANLCASC